MDVVRVFVVDITFAPCSEAAVPLITISPPVLRARMHETASVDVQVVGIAVSSIQDVKCNVVGLSPSTYQIIKKGKNMLRFSWTPATRNLSDNAVKVTFTVINSNGQETRDSLRITLCSCYGSCEHIGTPVDQFTLLQCVACAAGKNQCEKNIPCS